MADLNPYTFSMPAVAQTQSQVVQEEFLVPGPDGNPVKVGCGTKCRQPLGCFVVFRAALAGHLHPHCGPEYAASGVGIARGAQTGTGVAILAGQTRNSHRSASDTVSVFSILVVAVQVVVDGDSREFYEEAAAAAASLAVCIDLYVASPAAVGLRCLEPLAVSSGGVVYLYPSLEESALPQVLHSSILAQLDACPAVFDRLHTLIPLRAHAELSILNTTMTSILTGCLLLVSCQLVEVHAGI